MAVKLPASVGLVENVTVSVVAVEAVTVPTAPRLNTTVLLAAVVSKPKPEMASVFSSAARLSVLLVTTGLTVATCTADPLLSRFVVTIAVKLPIVEGVSENVTVKEVAVAAVTVPMAPLLNATVLSSGFELKPKPLKVTDVALAAKPLVCSVTTGLTTATCTGAPLLTELVVTTTVKSSAVTGVVERVTVSVVAVAAVTVPTAPLLKTTVLLLAVLSKPKPLMLSVVASAARSAVLLVTTGAKKAT